MTVDPAGMAAQDLTNPQTWNLYAYVLNNPITGKDPTGLNCVWDDGSYDAGDDPQTGNQAGCESQGGTWNAQVTGDWNPNPGAELAQQVQDIQNALDGDPNAIVSATLTPVESDQTCSLSRGQRVSLGVQGVANGILSEQKLVRGLLGTVVGAGFGPETSGGSAPIFLLGAYDLTNGTGQMLTAASQLAKAASGRSGPETNLEKTATLLSAPVTTPYQFLRHGISSTTMANAKRYGAVENFFNVGAGIFSSSGFSTLIQNTADGLLSVMGIANAGNCAQQ